MLMGVATCKKVSGFPEKQLQLPCSGTSHGENDPPCDDWLDQYICDKFSYKCSCKTDQYNCKSDEFNCKWDKVYYTER